jgi:hypothetical protein
MKASPVSLKAEIRAMTRGAYDLQKLRIQCGLRLVAQTKIRLGQEPGKKEKELDAESKKLLADLRARFNRITDGVLTLPRADKFQGDELISTYAFASLVANYLRLDAAETRQFKELGDVVRSHPIWDAFLADCTGVGPAMAGVLISEIDVTRMRHVSSVWRYAGLDLGPDGRGRGRYKEHLVKVPYINKDGEEAERDSITFNPFLKTKLYVLAGSFIKIGPQRSPYAVIYYARKHAYESHHTYGPHNDGKKDGNERVITSKGRRHNMAIRAMIKSFLRDLVTAWAPLEGVDLGPGYDEDKLERRHTA